MRSPSRWRRVGEVRRAPAGSLLEQLEALPCTEGERLLVLSLALVRRARVARARGGQLVAGLGGSLAGDAPRCGGGVPARVRRLRWAASGALSLAEADEAVALALGGAQALVRALGDRVPW